MMGGSGESLDADFLAGIANGIDPIKMYPQALPGKSLGAQ